MTAQEYAIPRQAGKIPAELVSVKELISRLSPTATIYEVARKAKCSHFNTKVATNLMLSYVRKVREEV